MGRLSRGQKGSGGSMKYSAMHLTCLTPEQHARTCGYWYTVTDQSIGHTAFAERDHAMQWLADRGLSIAEPLPMERGTFHTQAIIGAYVRQYEWSYDRFYALDAVAEPRRVDNGEYTLARITQDGDIRTEHVMNPNCKYRPKFDYAESRAMVG